MQECIFCKIVKGEIPCFKIYEDDHVLAFADINPISKGHTLIIPRQHADNIWEIQAQDLEAIMKAAQKVAKAIRSALKPLGLACLQLNGKAAGQVVMHYHLHLVPRNTDEPELPITHWEMKPGDMEAIKKIADDITDAMV